MTMSSLICIVERKRNYYQYLPRAISRSLNSPAKTLFTNTPHVVPRSERSVNDLLNDERRIVSVRLRYRGIRLCLCVSVRGGADFDGFCYYLL